VHQDVANRRGEQHARVVQRGEGHNQ
jgi:hypothetical protein